MSLPRTTNHPDYTKGRWRCLATIMNGKRPKYRGFSFQQYMKNKSFIVTDTELVKLDLLNHIYTRFGSRVKFNNFGTRIPDMSFEILDEITIDMITEDITAVINYDPRVKLVSLVADPNYDTHTLLVSVKIWYTEFRASDDLIINIASENAETA